MKPLGARTGQWTLASTFCLLLLAGLSCKYNVTLPWVAQDASPHALDSSFDQWSAPPDLSLPGSDARACSGISKEWDLERVPTPMIVAIDRSSSMQNAFDSTTKMLAASSALDSMIDGHPGISFATIWFPWTSCAGPGCCASPAFPMTAGKKGVPDASGGCGPYDAGCLSPSNDSPVYQALQQARSFISKDYWRRWNSTFVLITDRNPTCASESSDACDLAANEAGRLGSDLGARVSVMVPGSDGRSPPDCLIWIANKNSKVFSDNPQLTTVKTQREMRENLEQIANGIDERPCRYYMVGAVDDTGPIERIEIAGTQIQRDETGKMGWKTVNGAIQFPADLCRSIAKTPTTEVKAFTCRSGGGPGGPYGSN